MANESDKAHTIALDWALLSAEYEDLDTESLDEYVESALNTINNEDDYIKFLNEVSSRLSTITDNLDRNSRDSSRESFNEFRESLNKEFKELKLPELPLDEPEPAAIKDISLDWMSTSLVFDESITKELDDFVGDANIQSDDEYIDFLIEIGNKLEQIREKLGPDIEKDQRDVLSNFKTLLNNEFEAVGLPKKPLVDQIPEANELAIDWLAVSTVFEGDVTDDLSDYVINTNVDNEDDYIQFLIKVGDKLNDLTESLDTETRLNTINELNNFREQLNGQFKTVDLPEIPMDSVSTSKARKVEFVKVQKEAHPVGERQAVEVKQKQPQQAEIAHVTSQKGTVVRPKWHEEKAPDTNAKENQQQNQQEPNAARSGRNKP